jgi:hypothetical protein
MDTVFEISLRGIKTSVQIIRSGGQVLYLVHLKEQSPIIVSRAKELKGKYFWTSIPEGRQELAQEIGKLIDEYLKSN